MTPSVWCICLSPNRTKYTNPTLERGAELARRHRRTSHSAYVSAFSKVCSQRQPRTSPTTDPGLETYKQTLEGMSLAPLGTMHLRYKATVCIRLSSTRLPSMRGHDSPRSRREEHVRSLYFIGLLYLGVSGYALWRGPAPVVYPTGFTMVDIDSDGWRWFQAVKPYCNTLEAATIHRQVPPPTTLEGSGFSAACYALAGNIATSRKIISNLPGDDRWKAAGIVFDIGHPIADMGDDRSAGPIMELVVEFWPNHYQALYHAGASNYTLGRRDLARRYLRDFMSYYDVQDGFTRNAQVMLQDLDTP